MKQNKLDVLVCFFVVVVAVAFGIAVSSSTGVNQHYMRIKWEIS